MIWMRQKNFYEHYKLDIKVHTTPIISAISSIICQLYNVCMCIVLSILQTSKSSPWINAKERKVTSWMSFSLRPRGRWSWSRRRSIQPGRSSSWRSGPWSSCAPHSWHNQWSHKYNLTYLILVIIQLGHILVTLSLDSLWWSYKWIDKNDKWLEKDNFK